MPQQQAERDGTAGGANRVEPAPSPQELRRFGSSVPHARRAGCSTNVTYRAAPAKSPVQTSLEPDSDMLRGTSAGWPHVLSSLKTLLETGRPLPERPRERGGSVTSKRAMDVMLR
jgi:hypothetical protein